MPCLKPKTPSVQSPPRESSGACWPSGNRSDRGLIIVSQDISEPRKLRLKEISETTPQSRCYKLMEHEMNGLITSKEFSPSNSRGAPKAQIIDGEKLLKYVGNLRSPVFCTGRFARLILRRTCRCHDYMLESWGVGYRLPVACTTQGFHGSFSQSLSAFANPIFPWEGVRVHDEPRRLCSKEKPR
jgi:hypothetical protein